MRRDDRKTEDSERRKLWREDRGKNCGERTEDRVTERIKHGEEKTSGERTGGERTGRRENRRKEQLVEDRGEDKEVRGQGWEITGRTERREDRGEGGQRERTVGRGDRGRENREGRKHGEEMSENR